MPVLSDYDPDDDEAWRDDDSDDGDPVPCPECGEPVSDFLDKCPACGYWLSVADRRQMRARETKPTWIKATAVVLLVVFLWGVLQLVF